MEFKIGAVEKAARENGWHAIAIVKDRYTLGTVPHGIIAFVRDTAPFEDARCGTAAWGINEATGVMFFAGHYDLTRDEAVEDFVRRMAKEMAA